jgi:adhesin transport system membrane fusion protein
MAPRIPNPWPWLRARCRAWLPARWRRVKAETVGDMPVSDASSAASAGKPRKNVGIRRGGPGRRATDQVRQEPLMGMEAELAALRRGEPVPPGSAAATAESAQTPPRAEKRASAQVTRIHPGRVMRGDAAFLEGVREAQINEGTPRALWVLYLLCAIVISVLAWATQAQIDVVTKAEGKVVPDAREQVIASLEGGILRALHVREGAIVEAGDELVQLDPTRFAAQQNEGQARQTAMRGTLARLQAEVYGRALIFPPEVRIDAAVVAAETEAYTARRRLLDEAVAVTRRSIGLIDNELGMATYMSEQGLMSEVEVMRLRRQRNDLQIQVQERVNRFRQDASTELLRLRSELAQIGEQQVVKEDALKRTVLKSPLRGIVKNIRINTIGGVVPAGGAILEIVPITDRVLVEARIKPADIGFVHIGMPAEIKLSAYDYYTYGGLKGTIEYLSPDALTDERGGPDSSYYRARIRTDASHLRGKGDRLLSVLPGMVANVEIRTGDRTVMEFMLKPMLKGSEAFRER